MSGNENSVGNNEVDEIQVTLAGEMCHTVEKITVTSTTSPAKRSCEESVRKKRKKIQTEEGIPLSVTDKRIAQELPNCNWLERKIKMESWKREENYR